MPTPGNPAPLFFSFRTILSDALAFLTYPWPQVLAKRSKVQKELLIIPCFRTHQTPCSLQIPRSSCGIQKDCNGYTFYFAFPTWRVVVVPILFAVNVFVLSYSIDVCIFDSVAIIIIVMVGCVDDCFDVAVIVCVDDGCGCCFWSLELVNVIVGRGGNGGPDIDGATGATSAGLLQLLLLIVPIASYCYGCWSCGFCVCLFYIVGFVFDDAVVGGALLLPTLFLRLFFLVLVFFC